MDLLENHYDCSSDSNMVNYVKFIADLDIVFNLPNEEKDPLVKPPTYDYSVTHFKR